MTKQFCDRCGELVPIGKSCGGAKAEISGGKGTWWYLDFRIDYTSPGWILCKYCARELMDEAYKCICDLRNKEDNKDDTTQANK